MVLPRGQAGRKTYRDFFRKILRTSQAKIFLIWTAICTITGGWAGIVYGWQGFICTFGMVASFGLLLWLVYTMFTILDNGGGMP